MSEEEREKEQARQLAAFLDGEMDFAEFEDTDGEFLSAIETAGAISSLFSPKSPLNEAFSQTLRAKLVRETGKKYTSIKPSARRSRILQYAIAASFFFFFVPAFWAVRDIQEKNKIALIEKYDKMYVPISRQLEESDYLKKHLEPFSGDSQEASEEPEYKRLDMDSTLNQYRRNAR